MNIKIVKLGSRVPERTKKEREKPGPKTRYGGERLNFLPGEKIRSDMDKLIKVARKKFGEKLTYAYIIREGTIKEIRYIEDMLAKAGNGKLGPKQREGAMFPVGDKAAA